MGERAIIERGMETLEEIGKGESTTFVLPQELTSLVGRYGKALSGSDVQQMEGLESKEFDEETEKMLGLEDIESALEQLDTVADSDLRTDETRARRGHGPRRRPRSPRGGNARGRPRYRAGGRKRAPGNRGGRSQTEPASQGRHVAGSTAQSAPTASAPATPPAVSESGASRQLRPTRVAGMRRRVA